MPKLPSFNSKKLIKVFQRAGFSITHQTGSHVHLKNEKGTRVTVPAHAKTLHKGTLHAIIKRSGMTHEDFLKHA